MQNIAPSSHGVKFGHYLAGREDGAGGAPEVTPEPGVHTGGGRVLGVVPPSTQGPFPLLFPPTDTPQPTTGQYPVALASTPFLVTIRHNSTGEFSEALSKSRSCPDSVWLRGSCDAHGNIEWKKVPCKRRDCGYCAPLKRLENAKRVADGIEHFGNAAVMVLSPHRHADGSFETKNENVRRVNVFIRWLKSTPGNKGKNIGITKTWELTQRGEIHVNMVLAPFAYVKQSVLKAKWGRRISVNRVKDARGVGVEVAGSYTPWGTGKYMAKAGKENMAKLYQMVTSGRSISFSANWPKAAEKLQPKGIITWETLKSLGESAEVGFTYLLDCGLLEEVVPGRWRMVSGDKCDCFEPPGKFTKKQPSQRDLRSARLAQAEELGIPDGEVLS